MKYDPILMMNVPDTVRTTDASRGHEIVVKTENYLRSIGKNNSVGKYDRVVQGVKSLLEQGFLEGEELERAIKKEADRLLKKYNVNDAEFQPHKKYWSDQYHRYFLYKGKNNRTGKLIFEDFGDQKFDFTEEEAKKLKVKDAEVAWQEFNSKDQPVTKRKSFSSQEAMEKFIEKISEKGNFYKILGTRDAASVLDKAIKTADFGMRIPAKKVPEHQTYNAEYSPEEFRSKMKFFISQVNKGQDATSGFRQIKGICETVINDYKADMSNKNIDQSKTKAYYKQYASIAYQLVAPKEVPGPIRAWVEDKFYSLR